MECRIILSKDLSVFKTHPFRIKGSSLYGAIEEGVNFPFFYNKRGFPNFSDREKHTRLFRFLDNLGDVVATNHQMFFHLIEKNNVASLYKSRYGDLPDFDLDFMRDVDISFCTVKVPALMYLYNQAIAIQSETVVVHCVGFERTYGCVGDWDFSHSFVIYERYGELQVLKAESLNTNNNALMEIFEKLNKAACVDETERFVNLLSQG